MAPPPRLFGIPATDADVVAVLRRGPSGWWHVGRWLCYFTLRSRAGWSAGTTYVAVSRLPWATALAAWGTCGTWTTGMHFVGPAAHEVGAVDEGDDGPLRRQLGLAYVRPASFAVERRRGWTETPDSPPASPHDPWDEKRTPSVAMQKPRPGGDEVLRVSGAYAAFRSFDMARYGEPVYRLVGVRDQPLDGVPWADWSADGRLLVATLDGRGPRTRSRHLPKRDGGRCITSLSAGRGGLWGRRRSRTRT